MEKIKLNKSQMFCVSAIVLAVFVQGLQKILNVAVAPSHALGLVLAMFYTLIVAVIYYLISKSSDSFMGLLASIFAYKMALPEIVFLPKVSLDGAMLYFIVQSVAKVIFLVLIYKFYSDQEKTERIKALPILVLILAVPFANGIMSNVTTYLYFKTGSMLMPYFAQYACYAGAVLVTLAVAYVSSKASMRFVAYFELCALGVHMLTKIGRIGYHIVANQHVSKSLYLWLVLYAALGVIAFVMLNKSKKTLDDESNYDEEYEEEDFEVVSEDA